MHLKSKLLGGDIRGAGRKALTQTNSLPSVIVELEMLLIPSGGEEKAERAVVVG
jgi:hypothetical protein